MSIPFPNKPWSDKQTFKYSKSDGTEVIATYNASKNAWTLYTLNEEGGTPPGIITTADVLTLNDRPDGIVNPFELTNDASDVATQQEANWWLYEHQGARFPIFSIDPPTDHPDYDGPDADLKKGDVWINTGTGGQYSLLVYDGNAWVPVTEASRAPIFSDQPPTEHPDFQAPDNELITGDIWIDTTDPDNRLSYIWNGTEWIPLGQNYVRKEGGDSMEGPLNVTGQRSNSTGPESTIKVLNVDSGQNSALHLKQNGSTKVYVGNSDFTVTTDLKFSSGGKAIYATGPDKKGLVIWDQGVTYNGNYRDDNHIATKANVDVLSDQIIELEEEIEALAPTVERGFFKSTANNSIPLDGEFMLRTITGKTIDFSDQNIVLVEISKEDDGGTAHSFAEVEPGQLIQLFKQIADDYGLYQIESIAGTEPSTTVVTFTVSFVSGNGEATEGSLARLKIFSPPEGGTADDFIKSGGTTELKSNVTLEPPLGANYNFAIRAGSGTSATGSLFYVQDSNRKTVFRVKNDGKIQAGSNSDVPFIATLDNDVTTKKYVDDAVVRTTAAYSHVVLQYYNSSGSMEGKDGGFFWSSSTGSMLYRKGSSGRIIPELKVGDSIKAIKQNGSVITLDVTAVNGMLGEFFSITTTTLSTGVTLTNGEVCDVNFVFR